MAEKSRLVTTEITEIGGLSQGVISSEHESLDFSSTSPEMDSKQLWLRRRESSSQVKSSLPQV